MFYKIRQHIIYRSIIQELEILALIEKFEFTTWKEIHNLFVLELFIMDFLSVFLGINIKMSPKNVFCHGLYDYKTITCTYVEKKQFLIIKDYNQNIKNNESSINMFHHTADFICNSNYM